MSRSLLTLPLLLLTACPTQGPLTDDDDDGTPPLECDDGWLLVGRACIWDWTDDWLFLTDGVGTIESGGSLPSSLVVHGEAAFPVILDEGNRTFVAATRHGAGRAVVFTHEGYLGSFDGPGDMPRLVENAVRWVGGDAEGAVVGLAGFGALEAHLVDLGLTTQQLDPADLAAVDVLVVEAWNDLDEQTLAGITAFLADGGGVIAAGHAWYWAYGGGNSATEYSGSRMLGEAGLTWTPYGHVTAGTDVVPDEPPSILLHARAGLEALLEHTDGDATYSLDERRLAGSSAGLALDVLPLASFPDYFERARELADAVGPIVMDAANPLVRADRPIDEVVVWIDLKYARELPAADVWTHEGFTGFPGDVADEASTVAVTLEIDGTHAGLHGDYIYSGAGAAAMRSTGVYAPPGTLLTVTAPAAVVGAGLQAMIGCHTDSLAGADSWSRYPLLTRTWDLDAPTTEIASAFGGLVYVRVPTGLELGPVEVTIDGGVAAPWYRLGQTSSDDWTSMLATSGAPWAELASDSFIVSVPAADAAVVEEPAELMALWEEVLAADAELSGFDNSDRARAERFVVDRQISAGWMHSGYPLMAHLESTYEFVDLASLLSPGVWGPFHELGHNHQWRDWVLPGTTEATVNLFSVYVVEHVQGFAWADGHSALEPATRAQRVEDYLAGGADFQADWSVWTALETYLELIEGFGWEPFTQLFIEYRSLSDAEAPTDDGGRIDQWASRFGAAVDRDLGPFFAAWGFPLSQEVLDELAARPAWDEDPMSAR